MRTVNIQLIITECEQFCSDKEVGRLDVSCQSLDELKAAQTAIWNLLWGRILTEQGNAPEGGAETP